MEPKEKSQKKVEPESWVRGTKGGEMPDPDEPKHGETEDRVRDAFTGRPVLVPEPKGDQADRANADQEAELEERIAYARLRGKTP